jgi:hypothetical protein
LIEEQQNEQQETTPIIHLYTFFLFLLLKIIAGNPEPINKHFRDM